LTWNEIASTHNILFYQTVHIITACPVTLCGSDTWEVRKGKTDFQVREFKFLGLIKVGTQRTKLLIFKRRESYVYSIEDIMEDYAARNGRYTTKKKILPLHNKRKKRYQPTQKETDS